MYRQNCKFSSTEWNYRWSSMKLALTHHWSAPGWVSWFFWELLILKRWVSKNYKKVPVTNEWLRSEVTEISEEPRTFLNSLIYCLKKKWSNQSFKVMKVSESSPSRFQRFRWLIPMKWKCCPYKVVFQICLRSEIEACPNLLMHLQGLPADIWH